MRVNHDRYFYKILIKIILVKIIDKDNRYFHSHIVTTYTYIFQ